ncbi:hypothetical protein [Photobacterium toruni]|uniref:Uncharacterized protein n=1 Tax=Photobacterium toruni TaxID=1935446 RepID=A0A1T4UB23_9GAMM|nr:hypothetical protein [Photobacterium toruni]MEC6816336.1 hypothetical protein [Photobacterium toruni]SKA49859.1 hypothetical protein CZ814_02969 [Photobacterium toruni]
MRFFSQRNETDSEVRIELKTASFYLLVAMIIGWVAISFILQSNEAGSVFLPILIGFMMLRFFALVKVQKEVLIAMRDKRLTTQGSKFSFTNPFIYIIKKKAAPETEA